MRNHSGVLRISHKHLDNQEIENEKFGLYLQCLFSTSKSRGGFGYKHICKVFDFGDYYLQDNLGAQEIFKYNNKDKEDFKPIIFLEGLYGRLEIIPG